jgi:hypothetical protein
MPGHQHLGAEQRPVRGAENEDVVFRHPSSPLDRTLLARGVDFVVIQTEIDTENLLGVLSEER